MTKAYLIPDTPYANITPGQTGVKMVPINRMVARSFITNIIPGAALPAGAPSLVRGIAFGGDTGVAEVDFSSDDGILAVRRSSDPTMANTAFASGKRILCLRQGQLFNHGSMHQYCERGATRYRKLEQ